MIALYFIIAVAAFALGCWQGFRIAETRFTKDIEELKTQPVNVKYVHANFVPVTVEREVSLQDIRNKGSVFELMIKQTMMHELGEAVWKYAKRNTINRFVDPLESHLVYRATLYVRSRPEGVRDE